MSPSGRAHTNAAPDLSASSSSRASAGTSGAASSSDESSPGPVARVAPAAST